MFPLFVFSEVVVINRSSHCKCSDERALQNSCSRVLPIESIGKILEKRLRKSSFLVKLQA